jgi:hypothetical protein
MRNQLFYLSFIIILFMASCQTTPKPAIYNMPARETFTGTPPHMWAYLTVHEADTMIYSYQQYHGPDKPIFIGEATNDTITAFNIDSTYLNKMQRDLPGFSGLRVYLAIKAYSVSHVPLYSLVVVPRGQLDTASGNYNNILYDNYLVDWIEPCPPYCPGTTTQIGTGTLTGPYPLPQPTPASKP